MIAKKIILHCSASPNGKPYDISQIKKDHLARGFSDVGYHVVIQCDGEVQKGRPLNQAGAHCEGENHDSIGICLIGTDKFTREQFDALRYQLESLCMLYSIPVWKIYSHHQFPSAIKQGKTCPNIPSNHLVAWFIGYYTGALKEYTLEKKV